MLGAIIYESAVNGLFSTLAEYGSLCALAVYHAPETLTLYGAGGGVVMVAVGAYPVSARDAVPGVAVLWSLAVTVGANPDVTSAAVPGVTVAGVSTDGANVTVVSPNAPGTTSLLSETDTLGANVDNESVAVPGVTLASPPIVTIGANAESTSASTPVTKTLLSDAVTVGA